LARRTHSLANHPVDAEREEDDYCSAQRGSGSTGKITGSSLRGRSVEPVDDLRGGDTGYDERKDTSANRCPVHFISPFASLSLLGRLISRSFSLYTRPTVDPTFPFCPPLLIGVPYIFKVCGAALIADAQAKPAMFGSYVSRVVRATTFGQWYG